MRAEGWEGALKRKSGMDARRTPWLPPRVTLLSPGIWPGDVSGGPSWGVVSRRRPGSAERHSPHSHGLQKVPTRG